MTIGIVPVARFATDTAFELPAATDDVDLRRDQRSRRPRQLIVGHSCASEVDEQVSALNIPGLVQRLSELAHRLDLTRRHGIAELSAQQPNPPHLPCLLCLGSDRREQRCSDPAHEPTAGDHDAGL
jgi:hypothetical protein